MVSEQPCLDILLDPPLVPDPFVSACTIAADTATINGGWTKHPSLKKGAQSPFYYKNSKENKTQWNCPTCYTKDPDLGNVEELEVSTDDQIIVKKQIKRPDEEVLIFLYFVNVLNVMICYVGHY